MDTGDQDAVGDSELFLTGKGLTMNIDQCIWLRMEECNSHLSINCLILHAWFQHFKLMVMFLLKVYQFVNILKKLTLRKNCYQRMHFKDFNVDASVKLSIQELSQFKTLVCWTELLNLVETKKIGQSKLSWKVSVHSRHNFLNQQENIVWGMQWHLQMFY